MALIEFRDVRKTFRAPRRPPQRAVRDVRLTIEEGGVFGLLGPNGSGKTTALRILFGLVRPDSGCVTVLGHRVPEELPLVLPQVGALIEGPSFSPAFSGRRNLEILARAGGLRARDVRRALTETGLTERQNDPVKVYSLGMRQRLGIAAAILKRPRLLVLDEPANGLDPAGMVWMRGFITSFASRGRTVLLASHQLAEVEQVCNDVAIMQRGTVVAAGPVERIRAAGDPAEKVRVTTDLPSAASALSRQHGYGVASDGKGMVVTGADPGTIAQLLTAAGVRISEITVQRPSPEDAFLHLTRRETS
jgi:ABC-2 type transport system ATP-binding protein